MPQITHTEGESNSSEARKTWLKESIRPKSLPLMKRDADVFLHQFLSSPCVSTIAKAEGIWIGDLDGRRYMDFHGNSYYIGTLIHECRAAYLSYFQCKHQVCGSHLLRDLAFVIESNGYRWARLIHKLLC